MATARDFDYAIERKLGCTRSGKKHLKWVFTINGRLVGYAMRSHNLRGNQTISPRIMSSMAEEMHCSTYTWKRLLDCPGTREEYLRDLLSGGNITDAEYRAATH